MEAATLTGHEALVADLAGNLNRALRGKEDVVQRLMAALLAGGSVLMEDVPGVGKTTLAKALARSVDGTFKRVQFTPDLLPADILGSSIYNPKDGSFAFRHGPIFCHILLADEINRASPRTQSALLEAMSEAQSTIEGFTHPLPRPFMVIATQNPIEYQGTYPLPEAQRDRFLAQIDLGYPDAEAEIDMLYAQQEADALAGLEPVMHVEDLLALQQAVRQVQVERSVGAYLVELVRRTREDARLKLGVSPRGALMLFRAAQAEAFLAGRDYVMPDDIGAAARYVLPHRLVLEAKARYDGHDAAEIIGGLLRTVAVPA
ncbi:MAG: AAA domain-containing protein [Candidatus Hydrogenedens sp.]|nr:AAA domain-containing protein [Candidatus Hydrogenedens sp.]